MTIIISAKDKSAAINLFDQCANQFLHPGLTPSASLAVREHIQWMLRSKHELSLNCKLETTPELLLTRLTIELAFKPIAPLETKS